MDFESIRAIKDDVILSPSMPRIGVRISSDFVYLGDLQYLVNNTFHIEEFICICPNGYGHVTRLLLVHFAGFLESREGAYEYSAARTLPLEGEDYQYEVQVSDIATFLSRFPGSDLAHAADYIRQRAYTLVGEMIFHRFIRLVSPDRRNEFIVYYLERTPEPAQNSTAPEPENRLPENFYEDSLQRALNSFSLLRE